MTSIQRSTELAKRNPQLRALIKETSSEVKEWYGVALTDEQIVELYNGHPNLYNDALESGFDDDSREAFVDALCQEILGISWPLAGELEQYKGGETQFFADLKASGKDKGYKFIDSE